jgi:hypothetical protein
VWYNLKQLAAKFIFFLSPSQTAFHIFYFLFILDLQLKACIQSTVLNKLCWIIGFHGSHYEEHGLLSCNAIYSGGSLMFHRSISLLSYGLKSSPHQKPAEAGRKLTQLSLMLVSANFFIGSCFYPQDASDRFHQLSGFLHYITNQETVIFTVTTIRRPIP